MNDIAPQCIWPAGAELGEGPMWHARERAVYWVDIKGRRIHRLTLDSGRRDSWSAPGEPGFVLPARDGSLVCGLQDGLHRFQPAEAPDRQFSRITPVEPELPGNRLNDGYVDARGRLWFGTMDNGETEPSGTLYSLGAAGGPLAQDRGYVITNGPAMSPDGRTMYHTDTVNRTLYAFDVTDDGRLARRRVWLAFRGEGYPDGTAVDSEGCLWVAFFAGWRVDRYSPEGAPLGSVRLPCANVTKVAFGGDDLRTVFVTTAAKGLSPEERLQQPLAGGLFSFRAPVPGLPQNEFGGIRAA